MQLLVIDTQGNLRPTGLTTDVQLRLFERTNESVFKKTAVEVFGVSRKLLLQDGGSGGLIAEDENTPVYMGGYDFASSDFQSRSTEGGVGPPVQIRLRTRCGFCHGKGDLKQVNTFAIAVPPHPPRIRQLNPAAHEEADYDIAQKKKRGDFQSLRDYFDPVPAGGTYH